MSVSVCVGGWAGVLCVCVFRSLVRIWGVQVLTWISTVYPGHTFYGDSSCAARPFRAGCQHHGGLPCTRVWAGCAH